MDVGELIADTMARPWRSSLLRSLADTCPEKLPPLEITWEPGQRSRPPKPCFAHRLVQRHRGPKIFLPDRKPATTPTSTGLSIPESLPMPDPATVAFVYDLEHEMLRDLRRSRRRERLLIALFAAEVIFLVSGFFLHH